MRALLEAASTRRITDVASAPLRFREVQRMRHWFFYLPIVAVTLIIWYTFIQQVGLNRPSGSSPIPNWAAWLLAIVFGLGFPAFAATIRLITEVDDQKVRVRMFPVSSRTVLLDDIEAAEVAHYMPMREYGGWGVRVSRRGRAYIAFGNEGVQLLLHEKEPKAWDPRFAEPNERDKWLLIGSQRPEELLRALGPKRPITE
jgi:hypothetical protein